MRSWAKLQSKMREIARQTWEKDLGWLIGHQKTKWELKICRFVSTKSCLKRRTSVPDPGLPFSISLWNNRDTKPPFPSLEHHLPCREEKWGFCLRQLSKRSNSGLRATCAFLKNGLVLPSTPTPRYLFSFLWSIVPV